MAEVRPCPFCGGPMEVESPTLVDESQAVAAPDSSPLTDRDKDLELPPVPLLAPGSNDDELFDMSSSSRIVPAEPDPILGPYVTPSTSTISPEPAPSARSNEDFPKIELDSRVPSGPAREPGQVADSGSEPEDDEEDQAEPRRTSWATVLLASYASAITLGLAWTLLKDRAREPSHASDDHSPVIATAEPARQSGLSRKVEPPEPVLGEHFATMGQPLRVGDLEVTPVDVHRQNVTLERSTAYANGDRKQGGKGALVLRIKLRNTSKDSVFAPLDQAYLRERGKEMVDTFVETASGERIYPYPLAIESEWSIVGQGFDVLRPGESRTVAIASAPEAPPDESGPFTWRVRLRTGINRNDTIGLRWPEN